MKFQEVLNQLTKDLGYPKDQIIRAIREMGLDPKAVELTWGVAIKNQIDGVQIESLKLSEPSHSQDSEGSQEEEDTEVLTESEVDELLSGLDWKPLLENINKDVNTLTLNDVVAIEKLAYETPIELTLSEKVKADGDIVNAIAVNYVEGQYQLGQELADQGSQAMLAGLLDAKLSNLESIHELLTHTQLSVRQGLNQAGIKVSNQETELVKETLTSLGKRQEKVDTFSKRRGFNAMDLLKD